MRTRLAILAAACLLPGAAAPQDPSLQSVLECRTSRQASVDLLATLPVESDESEDGSVRLYYAPPPGLTVYGFTVDKLGVSVATSSGRAYTLVSSIISQPYAEVEAAALTANGISTCLRRTPAPANTCIGYQRPSESDGDEVRLMIRDFGAFVMIGCGYTKLPD